MNTAITKKRIIGFDLARAYAILGMFIVNFNTVFGSHNDISLIGKFLTLFDGNSSSMFVILSGIGIWLGRINWDNVKALKRILIVGIILFLSVIILQNIIKLFPVDEDIYFYLTANYIPPFLPFMISITGYSLIMISFFKYIGDKLKYSSRLTEAFASVGRLTLTNYIQHVKIGVIIFLLLVTKNYNGLELTTPIQPVKILIYSIIYYIVSTLFSYMWLKNTKTDLLRL